MNNFNGFSLTDAQGENILVLSKSEDFDRKEYDKSDIVNFDLQDRSELFAYLFQKQKGSETYKMQWIIYDFIDCFGVDMYAGFIKNIATVTDLDQDASLNWLFLMF